MQEQDRITVAVALAKTLLLAGTVGGLDARQAREVAALIPAVRCGIDLDEVTERLAAVGL